MSSPKISELAQNLLDRAIAEETNKNIDVAGLRETQTFNAFAEIANYYFQWYEDPSYFFKLLIERMHKREDEELHDKVMKIIGEKK